MKKNYIKKKLLVSTLALTILAGGSVLYLTSCSTTTNNNNNNNPQNKPDGNDNQPGGDNNGSTNGELTPPTTPQPPKPNPQPTPPELPKPPTVTPPKPEPTLSIKIDNSYQTVDTQRINIIPEFNGNIDLNDKGITFKWINKTTHETISNQKNLDINAKLEFNQTLIFLEVDFNNKKFISNDCTLIVKQILSVQITNSIQVVDTQKINIIPNISSNINLNDQNTSYEWINKSTNQVISTKKDLDILADTKFNNNKIYLKIHCNNKQFDSNECLINVKDVLSIQIPQTTNVSETKTIVINPKIINNIQVNSQNFIYKWIDKTKQNRIISNKLNLDLPATLDFNNDVVCLEVEYNNKKYISNDCKIVINSLSNEFNTVINNVSLVYKRGSAPTTTQIADLENQISEVEKLLSKYNNSYFLSLAAYYYKENKADLDILKNNKNAKYVERIFSVIDKKIYEFANALYYLTNIKIQNFIIKVLDDLNANYYSPSTPKNGNWWYWEIAIPKSLTKSYCLLYNRLNNINLFKKWVVSLQHFIPNNYGTGANLADTTLAVASYNALIHDKVKLDETINNFVNISFSKFNNYKQLDNKYNNYDSGFYKDGSYIEHFGIAYASSYGLEFLKQTKSLIEILKNSIWSINNYEQFEMMYQIIEYNFMPYLFEFSMPDILAGRSVTRGGYNPKNNGKNILSLMAYYSRFAPEKYKSRLIKFIVDQIKSYSGGEQLIKGDWELTNIYNQYKNQQITINPRNDNNSWNELNSFNRWELNKNIPEGIDLFNQTNKTMLSKIQNTFSFRNNDFSFNLKLNAIHNKVFESMNAENTFGYYQGDGLYLIENHNQNNYASNYWKTVDPFKLPGTSSLYEYDNQKLNNNQKLITENTARAKQAGYMNSSNKSNMVSLDDVCLVYGNLNNFTNELNTKKAYIKIGDSILVIGKTNKIKKTNFPIYTTIANDIYLSAITSKDLNINNKQVKELVSNKNAYYVLENTNAIVQQTLDRTVNFNVTQDNGNTTPLTNKFNEIYFDHSKTNNNNFAYLIVPEYQTNKTDFNSLISNLTYSIDDNYVKVNFNYNNKQYCLVSSFSTNVKVDCFGMNINLLKPTTIIFKKENNKYYCISSSNEYDIDNNYSWQITTNKTINNFNCLVYNNQKEVILSNVSNLYNLQFKQIYANNDKQHNSWITFELV